jgi:hypothetical protein
MEPPFENSHVTISQRGEKFAHNAIRLKSCCRPESTLLTHENSRSCARKSAAERASEHRKWSHASQNSRILQLYLVAALHQGAFAQFRRCRNLRLPIGTFDQGYRADKPMTCVERRLKLCTRITLCSTQTMAVKGRRSICEFSLAKISTFTWNHSYLYWNLP